MSEPLSRAIALLAETLRQYDNGEALLAKLVKADALNTETIRIASMLCKLEGRVFSAARHVIVVAGSPLAEVPAFAGPVESPGVTE